jgi:hypothetical protein
MRAYGWTALAVLRLEGTDTVEIPVAAAKAEVLSLADIEVHAAPGKLIVLFPRPKMVCILRLWRFPLPSDTDLESPSSGVSRQIIHWRVSND